MPSDSNRSNGNIERHYFEQFRSQFPLPPCEVKYGDKPDVLLEGDARIGIEITRLYLVDGADPRSEQRQSELRREALDRAQKIYLAGGGRLIELHVSFDPTRPITDARAVAEALATAATRISTGFSGEVRPHLFSMIPEVTFIYCNAKQYNDARWHAAQVYTTPALAVHRLVEIVKAKEAKVGGYDPCDAIWLLVIVDMAVRGQDQDIEWPAAADSLRSKFDRILIYRPQFGDWTEVPLIV